MSKIKQAIGITLFESDNFGGPKIVGGGICPTQRANKVCCGVVEVVEMPDVKIIGQMDNTIDHTFESANRVYDVGGVAPTMNTCGGGGLQPKILEANSIRMVRTEEGKALRKQYENHEIHHGFNENREPELRKDGVTNTLSTVQKDNYICVAMRGRNPTNPSDRTPGIELEQTLEVNQNGTTYGTVIADNLLSPNLVAGTHGYANSCIATQYRIRKLTPRECWRLMDFSDEDFENAAELNSNTQLYKQAGNSIVVNVLVAILGQMIAGKENVYKEKTKNEA